MRRPKTIYLIICCIGLLSANWASGAENPKPGVDLVAAGSVEGNKYTNNFFHFSYKFPQGWTVHGEATKERIRELGKEKITSSNAASNESVTVAEKRTQNLLTVFEHPLGTPGVIYNRGVIILAGMFHSLPASKAGRTTLQT